METSKTLAKLANIDCQTDPGSVSEEGKEETRNCVSFEEGILSKIKKIGLGVKCQVHLNN